MSSRALSVHPKNEDTSGKQWGRLTLVRAWNAHRLLADEASDVGYPDDWFEHGVLGSDNSESKSAAEYKAPRW